MTSERNIIMEKGNFFMLDVSEEDFLDNYQILERTEDKPEGIVVGGSYFLKSSIKYFEKLTSKNE